MMCVAVILLLLVSKLGPPFMRFKGSQDHLPQHEHPTEKPGQHQERLELNNPFRQDGNKSVFSDNQRVSFGVNVAIPANVFALQSKIRRTG